MKTRKELEDELARIQAELKELDDCEFKDGDEYYFLLPNGAIFHDKWYGNRYEIDLLKRGRISKDSKTLEDKDRREIIETQLLKYEVKGGVLIRGHGHYSLDDLRKKYILIERE